VKHLHIATGACPQTKAEARLEYADLAEERGDYRTALEYRAIVARWRRDWRRGGPLAKGGNPDAPMPEHGTMFRHDSEARGVVCPCGHFAGYLCDEPMGRGLTCDLPLCRCCRTEPREGFDLCATHAAREARA
jgi:hypothetical protein